MPQPRRHDTQLALDWALPGGGASRWEDLPAELRDRLREQLARLLQDAALAARGEEGGHEAE
jgi:hypothetical protein